MSDDTRERSSHAARDASAPPNGSDGNPDMFQPDGHLNAEMVSAWLDTPDDFDTDQQLAIESHLADCAQCSQIAAELTAIVRAFQQLPLVEAPRSFALTPEMAGLVPTPTLPSSREAESTNLRDRTLEQDTRPAARDYPVAYPAVPWYERQMRVLRWATAVAALLFVFVFSADLLGNVDTSGRNDDDSAAFTDAPFMTSASEPTAASGGAAMPEDEAAANESEDVARSAAESEESEGDVAEEESAADSAAGGELAETEATGGGSSGAAEPTAALEEDEQEAPPSVDGDAPLSDDTETMMTTIQTEEADGTEQEALVPQDGPTIAAYNAEQAAAEDDESDILHILELALVIVIAWLIVAMVALPRMRRPQA